MVILHEELLALGRDCIGPIVNIGNCHLNVTCDNQELKILLNTFIVEVRAVDNRGLP